MALSIDPRTRELRLRDSTPNAVTQLPSLLGQVLKTAQRAEDVGCPSRWQVLVSLGLLACVLAWTLELSWLRWGDPLVDIGEELYLPWQIFEGRVLYRDLEFARGPFTPYLNALVFWLAGPSYAAFAGFNIILCLVVAGLVYCFFLRRGGVVTATVTTSTFLLLFAFAQYEHNGTYNFVTPYSNEATHGLLLALVCIAALEQAILKRHKGWLATAGICCGLTFLTKPELFLALLLACFVSMVVDWIHSADARRSAWASTGVAVCAMGVPPLLAWLMLCSQMLPGEAFGGLIQGWSYSLEVRGLTSMLAAPLLTWVMGFDDVGGNLRQIALELCLYIFILAGALTLNRSYANRLRRWWWAPLFYCGLTICLMRLPLTSGVWKTSLRALPVVMIVYALVAAYRSVARNATPSSHARAVGTLALVTYTLAMMLRMILNIQIGHYGFTLAMPGVLLFFHMVIYEGGTIAAKVSGRRDIYMAIVMACLTALVWNHLIISHFWLSRKDFTIASTLKTYGPELERRGQDLNNVIAWLENETEPDATVSIFPEGAMLNFLAKRRSPMPIMTFNPITFVKHGDERIIDLLEADPPDYVLLVHRDNWEHGARYFGVDFGVDTRAWIHRNYRPRFRFGHRPFSAKGFGVVILSRRSSLPPKFAN